MNQRRPTIPSDDEKDLRAYFAGRAFDRLAASTLGPALDHAASRGQTRTCPVCHGVGQLDGSAKMRAASDKAAAKRCSDSAGIVVDARERRVSGKRIPHLLAYRQLRDAAATATDRWTAYRAAESYRRQNAAAVSAELVVEAEAMGRDALAALRAEIAALNRDASHEPTEWCGACDGRGFVPARLPARRTRLEDARPTGSSRHGSGGTGMDPVELERLGRVAGRIARVRARDAAAADALARWYSPGGGGIGCLLVLTAAGGILVREHARDYSDEPTPEQVLDRVRERQHTAPDVRTGSRLADARHAAEQLRERSVRAWLDAARAPLRPPPRQDRPRIAAPPRADVRMVADLVRRALELAAG